MTFMMLKECAHLFSVGKNVSYYSILGRSQCQNETPFENYLKHSKILTDILY